MTGGDDVQIITGTTSQTIHLPMITPASGTYTLTTGQPVTIAPGLQKVDITITLHREKEQP